jgi:hypothetical protein
MWKGPIIELQDWADFETQLRRTLVSINHTGKVLVRNFELTTADLGPNMEHLGETDRLQIVLQTGVDRDATSNFWNAPEHDYDHELNPAGKAPNDIIYAYRVDLSTTPYTVQITETPEVLDLTDELYDQCGILIYNPSHLEHVAKNEHWFLGDPREALLAVFYLKKD